MAKLVDRVIKEFPPIGNLRVRWLEYAGALKLDIREHVNDTESGFNGFTKRGIRLDAAGMEQLAGVLANLRETAEQQAYAAEAQDHDLDDSQEIQIPAEFRNTPDRPRRAQAAAAPETVTTARDIRPILDDILDATQQHMGGMVEAMPPAIQAKRETQKRLPLAPQAAPVKPAKRLTLSELAKLL